jgi:3-dehydroquinate synthase class II
MNLTAFKLFKQLICTRHTPKQRRRHHHHRTTTLAMSATDNGKLVWLSTQSTKVVTTALESGFNTFLIPEDQHNHYKKEWGRLGLFKTIIHKKDGTLLSSLDDNNNNSNTTIVGRTALISNLADLKHAEQTAQSYTTESIFVVDFKDEEDVWTIIPAENLVAAAQATPACLIAAASTASSARVMLEALETGTDGVLLRTNDPLEVLSLKSYIEERRAQGAVAFKYDIATVVSVEAVGSGDRACVDTAVIMQPGEGALVGNFARALFLVQSECSETGYVDSRPFRINSGAVHSYVAVPGKRTAYLSELRSGKEVLVVDAEGRSRSVLIGRVKVEKRPLVLVEAMIDGDDGDVVSALLQNAETVKMIGPSASGDDGWVATSVSELKAGDQLYVMKQHGARHTGISVEEQIEER